MFVMFVVCANFLSIYFHSFLFTSIHFYFLPFIFIYSSLLPFTSIYFYSIFYASTLSHFFFSFWFRVSWPRRLVSTYEPGSETDSCIELTNIETSTDVIEEQDYRAWNDDCDYDSQKAHGYE